MLNFLKYKTYLDMAAKIIPIIKDAVEKIKSIIWPKNEG